MPMRLVQWHLLFRMNEIISSSFYDSINKLLIGFLLFLPFIDLNDICGPAGIALLSVICWFIGLLFWGIVDLCLIPYLKGKEKTLKCKRLFSRNNIDWINHEYDKLSNKYGIKYKDALGNDKDALDEKDYLSMYYYDSAHGLLGNIPILEGMSALFRNTAIVLMLWFILVLFKWIFPDSLPWGNVILTFSLPKPWFHLWFPISLILLVLGIILCKKFRRKTEMIIFTSIIEAYLLHPPK